MNTRPNSIHRFAVGMLLCGALLSMLAAGDLQTVNAAPTLRYVAPGGSCGGATPCYATVQAAVDASAAGDEIRVAAGTYTGVNSNGGLSQAVYINKNITIKGGYTTSDWTTADPVTNATTLNALAQGRVVYINGAYTVTIDGLHLVFGAPATAASGGGIYIESATVTLHQMWITNNTAPSGYMGGGIYAKNAVLTVENSTIQDNSAGDGGGGVRILNSQATLENNQIAENTSTSATSIAGGGGVLIGGVSQVTMEGNTVQDNTAGGGSRGGGISVIDSNSGYNGNLNLTLNGNTIQGNEAGIGGGVAITNYYADNLFVYADITNNTIQNNYTSNSGAGIAAGATGVTISGNTIHENHAGVDKTTGSVDYGNGGGISASGTAVISDNQITDNEAKGIAGDGRGGGAYLNGSGSITFENNTVTGNLAYGVLGGRGGGVYATGDNVTILSNTIQGNSATGGTNYFGGGGLSIAEGDINVYSNLITDNSVSSNVAYGSGVTVYGCQPTLVGNTISGNTGGNGEGIYVKASSTPGQPLVYNNIISSQNTGINVDAGSPQNMAVVDGIQWWNNTTNTSGTVFPSNEHSGDPTFVNPAGYDYHLQATSPAINAGINANIPTGLTTDLDGLPRIANGTVELGADEYDGLYLLTVTKDGNGTGGVTSNPLGIDCGGDCSESFAKDTVVTLTPAPDSGSAFAGWSGDADCSDGVVTLNADLTCNATFVIPVTLTVTLAGDGSGTVTSTPSGIDCGSDCTESFNPSTPVTLSAAPAAASAFTGWSGDADCADGSLAMNSNTACTATFKAIKKTTYRSVGTYDGWILESTETSNKGGTMDASATTLYLGDGAQDKQYRVVLHFDTKNLPDTAVITSATLKLKKQGLSGTNPFTILGGLKVDMRKPYFGTAIDLVVGDFQAAVGKSSVATFGATPVSNWYSAVLNAAGRAYINKTGTTQFRLRFTTDDNNDNGADYMKFYSGNAGAATRPQLIIEYYVP